jgi:hypothetical protein
MSLRRPSSLRAWVALVYGAVGVGLLPWAIWLSDSLPPTHHSAHWDVAWSGFDVGLATCFCATAFAAHRRAVAWVGALAAATGTLLIVDAWFDVVLESRGNELGTALFEAFVFELPAALVCFWIAFRTERFISKVVDRALHLPATGQSPSERDLVRVLKVSPDGEPAREPGHPDTTS